MSGAKPGADWKETERRAWTPAHWENYVTEAERMVMLAQQNPHRFSESEYRGLLARRQHERFEFNRGRA